MNKHKNKKEMKITKNMKEVVIARIQAQYPENFRICIGKYGGLSKWEIIKHVKKEDEIGRSIIKSHISFMKALASGEFMKAINSVENG